MKTSIFLLLAACFMFACTSTKSVSQGEPTLLNSSTFLITEKATDPSYGYTAENAIKVGGIEPSNERRFLNALTGPNGEEISYERAGSCCPVKSKNALFGDYAMLDHYKITWKGLEEPISLYINMYDYEPLKIPVGFERK